MDDNYIHFSIDGRDLKINKETPEDIFMWKTHGPGRQGKLKKPYWFQPNIVTNENGYKLIYVAKVVDSDSVQYTKNTPNDVMYENMDEYINGRGAESNKKRAAQQFLDVSKLDMEELKIRSLIKDGLYYRFITTKAGGWIEPIDSGIRMGKRPSEVLDFLKDPNNEESLLSLMDKVDPYWNS